MKIDLIAGARPNFMKIAPIIRAIKKHNEGREKKIEYRLVHTGQHYDQKMSGSFFQQLEIPTPNVNLGAGSGTQAEQTTKIMLAYEKLLLEDTTDVCLVVGDVNSTMACAIVAKKLNIKVAHVEGGIRSFDQGMPEEINRMVTDSITDYFFTTSQFANENLLKEGHNENKIFYVGNTMIDTLLSFKEQFQQPDIWKELNLHEENFLVLTLHRPANVDSPQSLIKLLETITTHVEGFPIVFPIHPRTEKVLLSTNYKADNLHIVAPLTYLEFNYLVQNAKAVITDSGGITEETTVMKIPCLTLRDNTERPETCSIGTNELLGTNPSNIPPALKKLFEGNWKQGGIPELWDGQTAERIVSILNKISNQ